MHPMLNVAVRAARQAGRLINRASLDVESMQVTRKERNDFVTEVDKACEEAIIDTLLSAYPSHAILAEESGHRPGTGGSKSIRVGGAEGSRPHLDHRSTGRHHQLHPRRAPLLHLDRADGAWRDQPRPDLRPGPQRALHRVARARRLPERPPHPRQQAHPSGGIAHRHRLSLPDDLADRRLPPDAAAGNGEGRRHPSRRRRCSGHGLYGGGPLRRLLRARASSHGTSPRAACW